MAKFDLSKKKVKKADDSERSRKRKVKVKKKRSTTPKEQRKELPLELIPVSEKHPPENDERQILTWESEFGWMITNAALANQHIKADMQMFGYSRVRYWTYLE